MGRIPERRPRINFAHVLRVEDVSNEEIYEEVTKFWEIESREVKENVEKEVFDVNLEKRVDRYYVNLTWKVDNPMLCDNYEASRKRLTSILSRMQKNPQLMKSYCGIMRSQEDSGVIEEVKKNEESVVGKTYYMPHHAILREDKETSKTRIVFDGSSKSGGPSLNGCLHSGNTTFTDLLATLLKFRCYKIGMVTDIQQAFLSIGIKEEDRDALRFLWVTDPGSESPVLRHMRFTRVCFGIISSMAQLDYVIRQHLQRYEVNYTDTVERMKVIIC